MSIGLGVGAECSNRVSTRVLNQAWSAVAALRRRKEECPCSRLPSHGGASVARTREFDP